MLPNRFTIRVYGILIDKDNGVLLSNEKIGDFEFTKFPGGGLEFGEGPNECLVREFREETGIEVVVGNHIYTCDFYVQSSLDPEEQVMGIYYEVKAPKGFDFGGIGNKISTHDFKGKENKIRNSWVAMKDFNAGLLTFDMDKKAAEIFLDLYKTKRGNH